MTERLAKEWTSPIYAFFRPIPTIGYEDGRRYHVFLCAARECKQRSRGVRRFLDTSDAKSTGNMRKHAKKCWGNDVVATADKADNANQVRQTTVKGFLDPQSIRTVFERTGKGKAWYSHRQHTRDEVRAEIVRWVCESQRPFSIVQDRGFQSLMKTGRPGYYIPSASTVARDVKKVFVNTRKRVAKLLKEYDGNLNFATDAWTSPNHRAFIAVTVHFETKGVPNSLLLDIMEVPVSHSGKNLAAAFTKIVEDFRITDKVSQLNH